MVCLKFLPWAGSRSKLAFFAYQRYMRPKGCLCGFMLETEIDRTYTSLATSNVIKKVEKIRKVY